MKMPSARRALSCGGLVVVLGASSGCSDASDSSGAAGGLADKPRETVECLVVGSAAEDLDSASSRERDDPCAELSQAAIVEERPCDEVWQLGAQFPVPYYGCAADDGHQVFDLGVECDDPYLDGFWLYDDMMARQGGPVVRTKVGLHDDGSPAC